MTHMMISRGAYERTVQAIQSTGDTALYLSVPQRMADFIPSTACAISWPTGLQTTAVHVHLPWRMVPAPDECRIFALLGLQGIPAGTVVELYGGNTANPTTLLAATTAEALPGGTVGAWIVRAAGDGWTHEYFAWRIYNDVGGVTAIAGGATVYVGELYASPAWEWPVSQWEPRVVNPRQLNRASSGAGRAVRRSSYRMLDVTIAPQLWETAMAANDGTTMQDMLYDLQAQKMLVVIPRPERRSGDLSTEPEVPATNAMFADLKDNGGFGSDASTDKYPLRLAFEEIL